MLVFFTMGAVEMSIFTILIQKITKNSRALLSLGKRVLVNENSAFCSCDVQWMLPCHHIYINAFPISASRANLFGEYSGDRKY